MKLVRGGLTTYTERDGLEHENISAVFENSAGDLFVTSSGGEGPFINQFDGQRFQGVRPNVPKSIKSWGWGWIQLDFQDHTGEWWVATGQGLCRFPNVARLEDLAHTRPKAVYTTRDGLKGDNIFRLYEDSQGDLWISNINSPNEQDGVTRWARATQTFHTYGPSDAFFRSEAATAFGEDRAGNLWIGWFQGGLTRYRAGRAVRFTEKDGLSKSQIRFVYMDHAGRLWMPSGAGVVRLDDPAAERPRFVYYTTAQGLSSDDTWSATEDRWGRIYVTTGRGVDRIDPDTERIKHYTVAEGLPHGKAISAFRDRQGVLWFGTHHGLARLVPEPDRPEAPPTVLLQGLRLAGIAHTVSELGETEVYGLTLAANQNSVQIDYLGLSANPGEPLRYQYRMEGTGEDWSPPIEQRTVHYARLAPGSYRFAVRAVNADGLVSPTSATVAFTILKPVWQRGWFLMLAAGLVGLLSYGLYRMRIAQVIRLEQVRTRIATDLHDDIGSSLSQVAILGEVARQQIRDAPSGSAVTVGKMADTARSLVDTMSDIVWSIDPRRDDLASLVTRVRKFASDVLEGRGIAWDLQTPPDLEKVRLSPEQRQHLYLLFKEAIHNIVRHADASAAALRIEVADHQIVAELCDNGRGFDPTFPPKPGKPVRRGYGLDSMHARAAQMGGQLRIDSAPSHGTRLTLRVPIR